MSDKSKTLFHRVAWAFALLLVVVGGLWLSEPFIPTKFMFRTEDLEARAKYESIVTARGYSFSHGKNVHGETLVVIDGITPREYKKVACEFFEWSAKRDRSKGVVVYDRQECAL